MTNIIKFPGKFKAGVEANQSAVATIPQAAWAWHGASAAVVRGIWVFIVLVWPLLKWVISIDCVFQLARMMYHWNTPGVHAGFTFLVHFTVLTVLTYLVSIYKPKGM